MKGLRTTDEELLVAAAHLMAVTGDDQETCHKMARWLRHQVNERNVRRQSAATGVAPRIMRRELRHRENLAPKIASPSGG